MNHSSDWTEPSERDLDLLLGRLGNVQHRRYFYERLRNPRWLSRLSDRHVFASPPNPWIDAKGQMQLPRWPEGEYLARMASHVPDLAVDIVQRAKQTPNPLVHNVFVDVALAVPPPQSERLVPLASAWLNSPHQVWLNTRRMADWVAHLARGGKGQSALSLARTLIRITKSVAAPGTGRPTGTRAGQGVQASLDPFMYGEVLQAFLPDLIAAEGLQALKVVSDQLDVWLRYDGRANAADNSDPSWMWRPSIGPHERNRGNTIEDALVDALRDGCMLLAQRDTAMIPEVVATLERRRWTSFRRLALHLLASVAAPGRVDESVLAMARQRVNNAENLNDHAIVHEYSELARATLPMFDSGSITEWTSLVDAGPIGDEDELSGELQTANDDVDDRLAIYRDTWRRDRLGATLDGLPTHLRERYQELAARLGEPEHPDFASYMTGVWIGPTSPRTQQELLELGVDELVSYLNAWRPAPSSWPPGPSVDGLARELAVAVTSDPTRFAEKAEAFAASDRAFVGAILEGLEAALRQDRPVSWLPVLKLCADVAAKGDEVATDDSGPLDERSSWHSAQKAAASLLLHGLQQSHLELPGELAERVLTVLLRLTRSTDLQPSGLEPEDVTTNDDPVTTALNSTRGQAIRAIIAFAAWLDRHGLREAKLGEDALDILDIHLDSEVEQSPAVRSVYGQHFGVLLHVAPAWTRSTTTKIFGAELPLDVHQHAAGVAYLAFNRPSSALLDALRPQYKAWVEAVATGEFDQQPLYSHESIAERLGAHLLLLYTWGRIDLHNELLDVFFETAPIDVRRRVLGRLGWQLWNSKEAIATEVLERLIALWESRRKATVDSTTRDAGGNANHNAAGNELAAFGWWFRSDKFDRSWALRELGLAVDNGADVEAASIDVTQQLAVAAETDLDLTLHILDRLLQSARDTWRMGEVAREGIGILSMALRSNQLALANHAHRIMNELAGSGFIDIRDRVQAHG